MSRPIVILAAQLRCKMRRCESLGLTYWLTHRETRSLASSIQHHPFSKQTGSRAGTMWAAALLLLLRTAWTGQAQTPPPHCSLVLARKVPTKAVMAGRAFTTAVKVTNPGSMSVVVNLGIGLPDNVCAVKDGA